MKAVLQYRASAGFLAALARDAAAAGVEAVAVDEADEAAFAREIAEADVFLHVLKPITAAMIAAGPRLKLVQKLGVGVNTIEYSPGPGGVRYAKFYSFDPVTGQRRLTQDMDGRGEKALPGVCLGCLGKGQVLSSVRMLQAG